MMSWPTAVRASGRVGVSVRVQRAPQRCPYEVNVTVNRIVWQRRTAMELLVNVVALEVTRYAGAPPAQLAKHSGHELSEARKAPLLMLEASCCLGHCLPARHTMML